MERCHLSGFMEDAVEAHRTELVVALCGSEKKHRQSFEKIRRYAEGIRDESGKNGTPTFGGGRTFVFVDMKYDAHNREMTTDDDDMKVDVVLHKLSTLPPEAFGALLEWCEATSAKRRQKRLPPVVVIDPPNAARVVMKRSTLAKALEGRPVPSFFLTPRSWFCSCGGGALEPLGWRNTDSTVIPDTTEGSCEWWITKTDLSTGPSYTHRMVVWQGPVPTNGVPEAVMKLLPSESQTYIVQKFFLSALPFVLKVYCVREYVAIRAVSAFSLLRALLDGYSSINSNREGFQPVCIDSQKIFANKDLWDQQNPQLAQHWQRYLIEGGEAHTQCKAIAAQLSQTLQLSLFGFDLLLLPKDLPSGNQPILESPITAEAVGALLFEEKGVGSPTILLRTAVPMVVDVNYFPGYAGMSEVERRITEMIESSVVSKDC